MGSSPITSTASGTDKDVFSVSDSRKQVFLGNGVDQVIVSVCIHHLKQREDVVKSIAQLLLDVILSIRFICHTGSSRTAGDFIVTLFVLPAGCSGSTLFFLMIFEKAMIKSTGITKYFLIAPDVGIFSQLLNSKGTVPFVPQGLVILKGCLSNVPGDGTSASGVIITLGPYLFIVAVKDFSWL